ncbi:MAG: hypothetical protein ABSB49_18270 [Polyangia bacterium]
MTELGSILLEVAEAAVQEQELQADKAANLLAASPAAVAYRSGG